MGKRYGVPTAMNVSIIQGATLNKRVEVDNYNSKRDEYAHKKPELSLPNKVLEGMFNIYFYGYFNWAKMSKLEKGLYLGFIGMNAFGIALAADYVTKGAVKDTVKNGVNIGKAKAGETRDFLQGVYKGITTKALAAVIVADSAPKHLSQEPVVNASEVKAAPYQYDARIGNPDPTIPFIDIPEDKELADALQKQIDAYMEKSPKYAGEIPKYIVFRGGKDSTPRDMDFTKDKRQIIYIGDKGPALVDYIKGNQTYWGLYYLVNHEIGHKKFNKKDDGCNESKCIEMPAITYDVDAFIDAGLLNASERQNRIDMEWKQWKREHPNAVIKE